MSLDVAKQALAFLKETLPPDEIPKVSFYGGEPLLRFEIMRDIAEHAKRVFRPRPVQFNMTTNGTVMNESVARFLADHGVALLVSMDGPKGLHDRYRKDMRGLGSHDRVMASLAILKAVRARYFDSAVSINIVLAPPLDINAIDAYLRHEIPVPIHRCSIWLVDGQGTDFFQEHPYSAADGTAYGGLRELAERAFITENWSEHPLAFTLFKTRFVRVACRSRLDIAGRPFLPTGQCFPGGTKLYVDVAGRFHLCERVPEGGTIGHISRGIDEGEVRRRFEGFFAEALRSCPACFALRLCNVCLQACLENGEFSLTRMREACAVSRRGASDDIKSYARVIHANPSAFRAFAPLIPQRSLYQALLCGEYPNP